MDEDEIQAGLLDGVRIADFTQMLAGPIATMTLADLGASVTKVEPTGRGDGARVIGAGGAMFRGSNRNKRSIAIDLKRPAGTAVAQRLIAASDVVVEAFRPGVMERLGLGHQAVRDVHAAVVYASICGFGEGPQRERRGADPIIQAETGIMAITGTADGPPLKVGVQMIDMAAGMLLAQAVLAALVRRGRTGEGARLELNLHDVGLFFQTTQIAAFERTGNQPPRSGNSVSHAAPADLVRASDGSLMITTGREDAWQAMCRLLEVEWMIDDQRFAGTQARIANRAAMIAGLEEGFTWRTRADWCEVLDPVGVIVGSVRDYDDIFGGQDLPSSVVDVDGPDGRTRAVLLPYLVDGRRPSARPVPPPMLGNGSAQVLGELGYSDAETADLFEQAIVE